LHICYDELEAEARGTGNAFDPASWKAARERAATTAQGHLDAACAGVRVGFILDDNMYYRSMRKKWYHFARSQRCGFHQVFLSAPTSVCLDRNKSRDLASRVPDFSIQHMADSFEWPQDGGVGDGSWESRASLSTVIDTSEASTAEQVESFLHRWSQTGLSSLWTPMLVEQSLEGRTEKQGEAHLCDVALRKIVTRALANAPELGAARSDIAKRWGARKTELSKHFARAMTGDEDPPLDMEELIHDLESIFLKSCVADVQRLLVERGPVMGAGMKAAEASAAVRAQLGSLSSAGLSV